MHEKFACLGILLVLPSSCALESAVVCGLCGGVPCAIAAAGTDPVTVSGTGCHTKCYQPKQDQPFTHTASFPHWTVNLLH